MDERTGEREKMGEIGRVEDFKRGTEGIVGRWKSPREDGREGREGWKQSSGC